MSSPTFAEPSLYELGRDWPQAFRVKRHLAQFRWETRTTPRTAVRVRRWKRWLKSEARDEQDGPVEFRPTVRRGVRLTTLVLASSLMSACGSVTSTTTIPHSQPVEAMWPYYNAGVLYTSGAAAARGFAQGMLGMPNPVVGQYHSVSSTAGYVTVAPSSPAIATTVSVKRIRGFWWATECSTPNIVVTSPTSMQTITSPVALKGSAMVFEGLVNVSLFADGTNAPIATTTVTGGGDALRPFSGSLTFPTTEARFGTMMLYEVSMKDGSTSLGTAFRVRF